MTVPCSCKIPDPVVVNGTCLICYGERPSVDEIMTGPTPISEEGQRRADEVRNQPRRPLPVNPQEIH